MGCLRLPLCPLLVPDGSLLGPADCSHVNEQLHNGASLSAFHVKLVQIRRVETPFMVALNLKEWSSSGLTSLPSPSPVENQCYT